MKISMYSIVTMLYYLMSSIIIFNMSLAIEKHEEEQQEENQAQIQRIPIMMQTYRHWLSTKHTILKKSIINREQDVH